MATIDYEVEYLEYQIEVLDKDLVDTRELRQRANKIGWNDVGLGLTKVINCLTEKRDKITARIENLKQFARGEVSDVEAPHY